MHKCDDAAMKKLRCAVIGVGYLGKFHAQKYAELEHAELVAVVDANIEQAKKIAGQLNCLALANYQDLANKVDAVSIVTPTKTHFTIAQFCLDQQIHTLLEKPMTTTVTEANKLIDLAKQHRLILQIGHLERFNSAITALEPILKTPKFIESYRIAPFTLRGSDVNVVLDLMIHDIDLIQHLVDAEIKSIVANGAPILSTEIDIANARIEFNNGSVANVTASRAGTKQERSMRIFQEDAYIAVNLQHKSCTIYKKGKGEMFPGIPDIQMETLQLAENDAIKDEIKAFLHSITKNKPAIVPGEAGKLALETAAKITAIVGA